MLLFALACSPPAPPPAPEPEPVAAARPPRSDVVYFALVDRFADGTPDAPGSTDRTDPQAWHGGDLRGLIDRLDHLDELGFGALWISPVTRTRTEPVGTPPERWGAYHGYWMTEPDQVEPRFGTTQDLRELSDGLHARGMRLYLDLVVNHVGYEAPITVTKPEWFHHLGDVKDWADPVQVVTHDVHGLPDLAQENPEVARWLTDAAVHWVEAVQPDGFRIDAVRHVPEGFLAKLGAASKRKAGPGFQVLGEVFDGNPRALGERVRTDDLDAVFDFPLMYGIVESGACVEGKPLTGLAANLSTERHLPKRKEGALLPLVTLLDNHDVPRVASRCRHTSDVIALLYGLRGTPSITWGTEAGLDGAKEPDNRADMPWGLPFARSGLLRDLNGLRGAWAMLREGDQHLLAADAEHILVARSTPEGTAIVAHRVSSGRVVLPGAIAEGWQVGSDGLVPWTGEAFDGTVLARLSEPLPAPGPVPAARIRVDAPEAPGQTYAVAGSAPELGGWDAGRAVPVVDGVASVALPAGTASAVKLVRRGSEGVVWSQAADVLLLAGGEVNVPWQGP
jgi:glycosidase